MADQDLAAMRKWIKAVLFLRMQIYEAEKQLEQIQFELACIVRSHKSFKMDAGTVPYHAIFQINLERVMRGEDLRTTLMIKNIPNRYTPEKLLAAINKHINRGTYDLVYLPLDLMSKSNLGYAFINMIRPIHVVQLYKAFEGKRWNDLGRGKVAAVTYARIQGKDALISRLKRTNFKNLENCFHPILFTKTGNQEPFPYDPN